MVKILTQHVKVDVGKFLGLSRATMIYVVVILLMLTWGTTLYQIHQIQDLAGRDASATAALCVFRSDLVLRRDGKKKELVDQYGGAKNIPPAVIKDQLMPLNRAVKSLESLRCE